MYIIEKRNYYVRSKRYYYWCAVFKAALVFYIFIQTPFMSSCIARPAVRTFPGQTLPNGDAEFSPSKPPFQTS